MLLKPFRRSKTLLLFSLFLFFSAFLYVNTLFSALNIAQSEPIYVIVRYIILGLKVFFLAYLIITNKDRILKARSFLLVISVYLLSGIVSVLLNHQLFPIVIDLFLKLFTNILPIVLVFITASDSEELYEALLKFSYMQIPLVIIYPFSNSYDVPGAYMTYGYAFMIYWGIILLKKRKKLYDYLILIIWFILYIIYANRGALLCLVGMFFIYLIIFASSKHKAILSSSMIGVGILLLAFRNNIISILDISFSQHHTSRTISLILEGDFLYTSGRNILYDNAIKLIKENPLGYGLGYDRLASAELGYNPVYIHNIFLELLLNYGVIIGIVIIALILGIGLAILLSENSRFSQAYKKVFAVFYTMGFIQLMFSSSIVESIYLPTALLVTMILTDNKGIIWKKINTNNRFLSEVQRIN